MPHPGFSKKEFDKLKHLPLQERQRPDAKFLSGDNPDALWAPAIIENNGPSKLRKDKHFRRI